MSEVTAQEIRTYLAGLILPATPETVVAWAKRNGAPPEVIRSLEQMPPGEWHSLDRVIQVWEKSVTRAGK